MPHAVTLCWSLAADQGAGKSHFGKLDVSAAGYFIEKHVNPDDKDCSLYRTRAFVWEIMEIGATTKRADVEALKAHITATTVTERKAYGHYDTVKPAVASYIGTVNPDGAGFLQDTTGNRRFAVVYLSALLTGAMPMPSTLTRFGRRLWRCGAKTRPHTDSPQRKSKRRQTTPKRTWTRTSWPTCLPGSTTSTAPGGHCGMAPTSSEILEALRTYAGLSRGSDIAQARQLSRTLKRQWGITSRRKHGRNGLRWSSAQDVDHA